MAETGHSKIPKGAGLGVGTGDALILGRWGDWGNHHSLCLCPALERRSLGGGQGQWKGCDPCGGRQFVLLGQVGGWSGKNMQPKGVEREAQNEALRAGRDLGDGVIKGKLKAPGVGLTCPGSHW